MRASHRVTILTVISCVLLTACASSATPTTPATGARLPTRRPTAVETDTPTGPAPSLPAEAYHRQGVERQQRGDLLGARRYFDWAIRRDPAFAPAYVSRGTLHLAEGELDRALSDAQAALEIEPTARAHWLRGEVLHAMGRHADALQAFDHALARDPALRKDTFHARWEAARAAGNQGRLSDMGAEFSVDYPADPLRSYYQGWPLLTSEQYDEAIDLLVEGIEGADRPPALLWYLLGRAYIGIEAWQEAILSLEEARELVQVDDVSMAFHTDQPVGELFVTLGRAYLGAGRCADAETMLAYGLSIGAPMEGNVQVLEEARICQTPTPEPTPTP